MKVASDPVCKMNVDEKTAKWTYEHEGTTYYFCAEGCKEDFEDNPAFFLKGGGAQASHPC